MMEKYHSTGNLRGGMCADGISQSHFVTRETPILTKIHVEIHPHGGSWKNAAEIIKAIKASTGETDDVTIHVDHVTVV